MSRELCPGISRAASGPGLCPTGVLFLTLQYWPPVTQRQTFLDPSMKPRSLDSQGQMPTSPLEMGKPRPLGLRDWPKVT